MKAIVQLRYGDADALELRDLPMPMAGDGEVLVRVRAAGVHPDVWHVVYGRPYALRFMGAGLRKPKNPIPGTDIAGQVERVGKGHKVLVTGGRSGPITSSTPRGKTSRVAASATI